MKLSSRGRVAALAAAALLVAVSLVTIGQRESGRAEAAGTPTHIMTYILWGASENNKGLPGVNLTQAAHWVTWTIAKPDDTRALSNAGIHTMYYTDPNRVAPNEPLWADDDTMFAHDCSNNRISIQKPGSQKLLTDPNSSTLQQRWRSYVQGLMSRGHYDAIYDDTAATLGQLSALPCHFDQNQWIASHANLVRSLGVPVIYNGLGDGDLVRHGKGRGATYDMSYGVGISEAPNALGGSFEDCYTTASEQTGEDGKTFGSYWEQTENTELAMASRNKIFMCENMAPKDATMEGSIDQRMYAISSILLTVDPATTMIHQLFHTPSHIDVGPEVGLVPTEPTASAHDISDLHTSGGAYVREYRACYLDGSSIGPCAVAVNSSDGGNASLSLSGYHHTLSLSGGGVLDGGTASADGPAPPSSLGPVSGIIATR